MLGSAVAQSSERALLQPQIDSQSAVQPLCDTKYPADSANKVNPAASGKEETCTVSEKFELIFFYNLMKHCVLYRCMSACCLAKAVGLHSV